MKPGVLVISHGSREAEWVRLVDEAVETAAQALRRGAWVDGREPGRKPEQPSALAAGTSPNDEAARDVGKGANDANDGNLPVVSSFLEIVEGRLIQDGIDRLEAEGVTDMYVLPLFVSSGSTHVDDIAQAFGLPPVSPARPGEMEPFRCGGMRVHFGQPIDDDPDIAELLLANIRGLSEAPQRERLLLVAHGSRDAGFYSRWRAGMTRLAERMRQRGGFAGAETAMLLPDQAACKLRALQRKRPEETVIVVPLFLSAGYFTRTVIPSRLKGLTYQYNGVAMLPGPHVPRWMYRQIAAWLEKTGMNRLR